MHPSIPCVPILAYTLIFLFILKKLVTRILSFILKCKIEFSGICLIIFSIAYAPEYLKCGEGTES